MKYLYVSILSTEFGYNDYQERNILSYIKYKCQRRNLRYRYEVDIHSNAYFFLYLVK